MVREFVEKTVVLPEGFSAEADGNQLTVKASGKEAKRQFKANGISLKADGTQVTVIGRPASRRMNALASTISSHISNMAAGLKSAFVYKMTIVYSHFPMNVKVKDNLVEISNFVGEKKTRLAKVMPGVSVEVKGKDVLVRGPDKEAAGQTAANIESAAKVKGKDKRIYQDGIFIVEKAVQENEGEGK